MNPARDVGPRLVTLQRDGPSLMAELGSEDDGARRRGSIDRGSDAALHTMEMLEAVYQQIPTPVLLAFVIFIAHIIVITDTGAGVPIFFPIFKRCMRPFKPTVAYERLKSKYLIS